MKTLRHVLVAGALALALPAAFAQTELRAWNIHPDGYPVTVALSYFAELVQQGTQNRLRVKVYSNASMGDQPKAVQMMKSGELDLAEFSLGPLSEAAPSTKALTLPFLFRDSKHMFRQLDGVLGARFEAKLKQAGYVVLGWYDGGARSFYCVNKQIRQVQDFSGLRIRVQQSETAIEMVKLLGATPVVLPYKEVLDALKDNRIDCAENNLPSYESAGHAKVAKFMYLSNHTVSPEALVMSVKAWSQLSPDDQARFQDAGRKSAVKMRELWNQRVEEVRASTTKQGSQFSAMADHGPLVSRMRPLHQKYMEDPQTREELFTILTD
ncbi:MAG TPA: TRAP transporter substrate-binding protein [Rhizobacter sp.]|nr:TRAP transporter substrate-binding protein [Rhizobacter sp.]